MRGGEFIREARKRAGLTQRELAEELGTTQAVIARWETGERSPTFERLQQAVRACGLELAVSIVTPDYEHGSMVDQNLRATPEERLRRVVQGQKGIDQLLSSTRRRRSR